MNITILAIALLAAFLISVGIKKSDRQISQAEEDFWEKERKANFVRKKSLDNLNYITIPEEFFTYKYDIEDSHVKDALDSICHLKECKIVNFSGMTNTDLKLEYGTANLTILSEYDYNYTILARNLQVLAEDQYKANNISNAKAILHFAIETGSDMKSTYSILADIYSAEENVDELNNLLKTIESTNSLMKTAITEYINELLSNL